MIDGTARPRRGPSQPRLCMIVHGPYPVGEPRVSREAAAAIAAGYEVDVVAMSRDGEAAREVVDRVTVHRLPLRHRRGGGAASMIAEYVGYTLLATAYTAWLSVRRRYRVVQVHNPPDFLIVAGLFPKALGALLLLDIHDLAPDMFSMRWGARPGASFANRLLLLVERAAFAVADGVVTVHEPYRRELIARGARPDRVTTVMNSVDERLLPAPDGGREDGGFRVFYHGTITPSYGVGLIVEAAARIRDAVPGLTIELCGEGDAVPEVLALANRLGVADLVTTSQGYVPQREALRRACHASVGVIPNLPSRLNRFALSSKLFEYVVLGVPVVSAELPTIREHFTESEVAFFRPGDAVSLADALVAVARDPEGAHRRAERARRRYEEYRWDVSAARYTALLGRSG